MDNFDSLRDNCRERSDVKTTVQTAKPSNHQTSKPSNHLSRAAILHYWLTNVRGGEKVVAALAKMLPDADIFTHAYVPEKMGGLFAGRNVRETFIAKLPLGRRHPQAYLPLMPLASRSIPLDGYDLIVSSESGPIKGIRKPQGSRHICYCHTPMRYLWDMADDYYRTANLPKRIAMRLFTPVLRKADLKSAEAVDLFIANSAFVAERIKRIYRRDAIVIHPPVDVGFFKFAVCSLQFAAEREFAVCSLQCAVEESAIFSSRSFSAREKDAPRQLQTANCKLQTKNNCKLQTANCKQKNDYYLFAGANVPYKRLDLAQEACGRMGRRLVVAGGGSVTDEELRELYANAKALIFPGVEDFGIVPVEAQAAGTPVIAFGRGGALETVVDGETGLFFREQTVEALCNAIEEFEGREWSPEKCTSNAMRFSPDVFREKMGAVLF